MRRAVQRDPVYAGDGALPVFYSDRDPGSDLWPAVPGVLCLDGTSRQRRHQPRCTLLRSVVRVAHYHRPLSANSALFSGTNTADVVLIASMMHCAIMIFSIFPGEGSPVWVTPASPAARLFRTAPATV